MYIPVPLNDFTSVVRNSAQVISGSLSVFTGIKRLLGEFTAYLLVYILAIPFVLFIRYLRILVKNNFPSHLKVDSSNYSYVRISYDKSNTVLKQLQPIKNINTSCLPFAGRLVLNQIQKLVGVMEERNTSIAASLSHLDNIAGEIKPHTFTQIKESDLWVDRPKVYQYRV